MFVLISAALKEAVELSGFVESVPLAAPRDQSIAALRAARGIAARKGLARLVPAIHAVARFHL